MADPRDARARSGAGKGTHKGARRRGRPGLLARIGAAIARPRLGRRGRRVFVALFALCMLVAASGIALFTFPLPAFLVQRPIVNAIEQRLGGDYSVTIGEAVVDAGREGLDLRLNAFEIRDGAGTPVLRVPSATVALDGNLIFGRRVGLRRIRLAEPRLILRVDEEGGVSFAGAEGAPPLFSLSGSGAPKGAPAEILGFLAAGDAMLSPDGALANFELAEIQRGTVAIDDRRRGRVERIGNVDLRVSRRAGGNGLIASASSSDPSNRWSVTGTLSGRPDEPRALDIGFQNLALDRLAYEGLGDPALVRGQLFGHMFVKVDPDGSVPAAEARIEGVGVHVAPHNKPEASVTIDRARIRLQWHAGQKLWRIAQTELESGASHLFLTGEAHRTDEEGMRWSFALKGAERGEVPAADRIEEISILGTLDRSTQHIEVTKIEASGATVRVAGNGSLTFSGEKPQVDVALAVSTTPVHTLTRAWPAPIAYEARKWLLDHVQSGTIESLSVAVRGPLGPDPEHLRRVAVDARFTQGTVAPIENLPPAVGATGVVRVADRELTVEFSGGHVDAGGEEIRILNGRFFAPELDVKPLKAEVVGDVEGPITGFAHLLELGPLRTVAAPPAFLASAKGRFKGNFALSGRFGPDADARNIAIRLDGNIADFGTSLPGGMDFTDGDFRFQADSEKVTMQGEGRLSGAPLVFEGLVERKPDHSLGAVSAAFTVDPSRVKGLALGELKIQGPVSARISLPNSPDIAGARVEADISAAALKGLPGLDKQAGKSGSVAFDVVRPDERNVRLSGFAAQGDGFEMRGTVDLSDEGELRQARFDSFKLSNSDDATLSVDRTGARGFKIVARGSALDARDLLRDILADPGGRSSDLDLEAKIGTVLGHNGQAIAGLDLKLARRGGDVSALHLSGLLGGGPIEGRMIEGQTRKSLGIRSADAGAVFRFFDIYTRIQGGQMQLEFAPGKPNRGFLGMSDFRVAGEQALASVKTRQPPRAGYSFSKMRVIFRQSDGRIIVDDGTVWGPDLGATIEGEINYAANRVDVRGTFVPAYALNNFFGRLPIIGNFLGGAQEGLVGITYQVEGRIGAPQLRVNPLSAVAPGFLRKLFEFRDADPQSRPSQ